MGLEKGRRYLESQTLDLLAGLYENFVREEIIYVCRLRAHITSKSTLLWLGLGHV